MNNLIFVILLTTIFVACHTTLKSKNYNLQQIPKSLLGKFKDDYGSIYQIQPKEWIQDGNIKYHLLQYNKRENYFIAQNDNGNPSDRGLYSRIDIMYFENMKPWVWGYCLTTYKAASVQEAMNTVTVDRINPRKGCNGYPFSRMKRE